MSQRRKDTIAWLTTFFMLVVLLAIAPRMFIVATILTCVAGIFYGILRTERGNTSE